MSDTDPSDPIPPPNPPPEELHGLDPGELFARGIHTVKPSAGEKAWVPPTPEELARLLPQYQIESLLGCGGMGAVYKGAQPALDRPVAIKLLPAEVAADEQFISRFRREARTLAKLHHPGIVAVYDFGQTGEGHLYFVMEYVDGTDLRRILKGPGLAPEQALELIGQICEALQAAHKQGVIHRDIKPANILIANDGCVKLADFGLARPLQEEDTGALTGTNMIMGTPDYMSPEQRIGHVDHRTDIFALGVMLYEMLTGKCPRGAFVPPSRKVQVDVRIDEVVLRALQEEPDLRYQQVSEMKTDVDHIRSTVAPEPVIALPPRPGWRKPLAIALSAVVVVLLAGAGFFIWKKQGQQAPASLQTMGKAENNATRSPSPAAMPVAPIATTTEIKSVEQALVSYPWQWVSTHGGLQDSHVRFLSDGTVKIPKWKVVYHWAVTGPKTFTLQVIENEDGKIDNKVNTSLFTFDETFTSFEGHDPWLPHRDYVFTGIRSAPVIPTAEVVHKIAPAAGSNSDGPFIQEAAALPPQQQVALPAADKKPPWKNSLGMKFVPVPGTDVLFCIWPTRVQDYQAFATATGQPMVKPGFPQEQTHPVVNVSWDDAKAFCEWLTKIEHTNGKLPAACYYRLARDREWSTAAGSTRYPWGDAWPPPRGFANYAPQFHTDDFDNTSPVGSFPANPFGLFDMSGNVKQWCEDEFRKWMYVEKGDNVGQSLQPDESLALDARGKTMRLFRGTDAWDGLQIRYLTSFRERKPTAWRQDNLGFRCVIASSNPQPPTAELTSHSSGTSSLPSSTNVQQQPENPAIKTMAWMLESKDHWPKEITLTQPVTFQAVINGAASGAIKAPAGTIAKVMNIKAGQVTVEWLGNTKVVPIEATDLMKRAAADRALAAGAPHL